MEGRRSRKRREEDEEYPDPGLLLPQLSGSPPPGDAGTRPGSHHLPGARCQLEVRWGSDEDQRN